MATALFGDSPVPNAAKCVTIKAGKCDMVMQANGKFMCTPKLEKGKSSTPSLPSLPQERDIVPDPYPSPSTALLPSQESSP